MEELMDDEPKRDHRNKAKGNVVGKKIKGVRNPRNREVRDLDRALHDLEAGLIDVGDFDDFDL